MAFQWLRCKEWWKEDDCSIFSSIYSAVASEKKRTAVLDLQYIIAKCGKCLCLFGRLEWSGAGLAWLGLQSEKIIMNPAMNWTLVWVLFCHLDGWSF